MCLLCIEVIKEQMKPRDFWRNYKEVVLTDKDDKHWAEVVDAVKKTSKEYQESLAGFFGKDEDEKV